MGNSLQHGPDDVVARRAAGEADEHTAGMRVPVGSTEAGERRDADHAAGVGNPAGGRLGLGGRSQQAHFVAQPLHRCAADEDAPLQGVVHAVGKLPGDGGQQAVLRLRRAITGLHQEEAAGAIGGLGRAGTEACLPEERRLLVPGNARDRHSRRYWADRAGPRPHTGGREHLWQYRCGYVERRQQLIVPRQAMEIEEQGARGVGGVGGVEPPAGQLPDQPRVHRAEGDLAGRGAVPQLWGPG